jgi:hypothetical protein
VAPPCRCIVCQCCVGVGVGLGVGLGRLGLGLGVRENSLVWPEWGGYHTAYCVCVLFIWWWYLLYLVISVIGIELHTAWQCVSVVLSVVQSLVL